MLWPSGTCQLLVIIASSLGFVAQTFCHRPFHALCLLETCNTLSVALTLLLSFLLPTGHAAFLVSFQLTTLLSLSVPTLFPNSLLLSPSAHFPWSSELTSLFPVTPLLFATLFHLLEKGFFTLANMKCL